jgi:hypothetical protein
MRSVSTKPIYLAHGKYVARVEEHEGTEAAVVAGSGHRKDELRAADDPGLATQRDIVDRILLAER